MTNALDTRPPGVDGEAVSVRGEALIARAIDAGLPVESLERLMALRDRLRAEDAETAFFTALSAFQGACPIIPKTKTVTIRPQSGAPYSYAFAPIEVIMATIGPLLTQHGLSITIDTVLDESRITLTGTVHHVGGHSQTSTFAVPIEKGRMSSQHAVASANTYGSRYLIRNAVGVFTGDEDDDAAGAGGLVSAEKPAVVAPPPPRRKGSGKAAGVSSEPTPVADPEPDPFARAERDRPNAQPNMHDLVQRVADDLSLEDTLHQSLTDAPITEEERRAVYGGIRLLLTGQKIPQTPDNLQRAKTAIKLWLAREVGVEHLEDIPQSALARVRFEMPRLVKEAFAR